MYIYILTGKLFGRDIYEIDVIDDTVKRIESDRSGFPNLNIILFSKKINFCDPKTFKENLKSHLKVYEIHDNYYKIPIEDAKNIILKNLEVYDVEPKPEPVKMRVGCLGFSY